MKIALDIDDTITKHPDFFSELSHKHDCIIVTSRANSDESMKATRSLLTSLNIKYSSIHYCDWSLSVNDNDDEFNSLEGPEILLFQKIIACRINGVDAIFDDDITVQNLMRKYLPEVAVFSPV
jgi:hypothetical protein